MEPAVGCRNLVSKLKKVVLPAPLGPIRACISPRRTRRETPSTAMKPLNAFVRPCVSSITSGIDAPALSPSIAGVLVAALGILIAAFFRFLAVLAGILVAALGAAFAAV